VQTEHRLVKLLLQEIRRNPLLWLLVFVPIALAAEKLNHEAHTLHFVLSVLAILPIAFLRYAQAHQPEVVVIDILMPVMNGLEVQSRLRTLSPSTRLIVLTSNDDPTVRSQAMRGGALAFFLKPASNEKFLTKIESAVSRN
jgi:DNA-binding NarL/FixJ family response regulator